MVATNSAIYLLATKYLPRTKWAARNVRYQVVLTQEAEEAFNSLTNMTR